MSKLQHRSDSQGYRQLVLGLLFLHYMLNYLDRQVVGILAVPIKQELHLSDTSWAGSVALRSRFSTQRSPCPLP